MKKMFSFLIYILLIWCARSEEDEVFYPLTSSTDNPLSDITPEIGTEVSHRGWEFMVNFLLIKNLKVLKLIKLDLI